MREDLALGLERLTGRDDGRVVCLWFGNTGVNLRPLQVRELHSMLSRVLDDLSFCEPSELRCGGRT
jgi:hypothetical protein